LNDIFSLKYGLVFSAQDAMTLKDNEWVFDEESFIYFLRLLNKIDNISSEISLLSPKRPLKTMNCFISLVGIIVRVLSIPLLTT
jgi:hypothetical protein